MDVLILTAFVSIVLVVVGLLFFAWNLRQGSHEHNDRLVLLPFADETTQAEQTPKPRESP